MKQTQILVALAIVATVLVGYLLYKQSKKKKKEAEMLNVADANATAAENGQPLPVPTAPSAPVSSPPPPPAKPVQDVMNQDPTYVMATRVKDSVFGTWSGNKKTELWNTLAAAPDVFVRHVNNWFGGQFGQGKSMRQQIEDEITGNSSAILGKLSRLGL